MSAALVARYVPHQRMSLADIAVLADGHTVGTVTTDGPSPGESMVTYDLAEAGYGLRSAWRQTAVGEWQAEVYPLPEVIECPAWCCDHKPGTRTGEAVQVDTRAATAKVPQLVVSHEAPVGKVCDANGGDLIHVNLLAYSVVDAGGYTHSRPGAVMYSDSTTPPFLGPRKARELSELLARAAELVAEARRTSEVALRAALDLTGTAPRVNGSH